MWSTAHNAAFEPIYTEVRRTTLTIWNARLLSVMNTGQNLTNVRSTATVTFASGRGGITVFGCRNVPPPVFGSGAFSHGRSCWGRAVDERLRNRGTSICCTSDARSCLEAIASWWGVFARICIDSRACSASSCIAGAHFAVALDIGPATSADH